MIFRKESQRQEWIYHKHSRQWGAFGRCHAEDGEWNQQRRERQQERNHPRNRE